MPSNIVLRLKLSLRLEKLALEGWAQGYLVGSIVIMAAITVANMRRGVLLHKLILLELFLGMSVSVLLNTVLRVADS